MIHLKNTYKYYSYKNIILFSLYILIFSITSHSSLCNIINTNKDTYIPTKSFEKKPLVYKSGDSEFRFSTRFRPEFFYGRNLRFLNNDNEFDKLLYLRHTLDFNGEYHFGHKTREYDVILGKINIRNRYVWGDPESVFSTVNDNIKDLEVVYGSHNHYIPRLLMWIRELWVRITLNDLFNLSLENHHHLVIGAFPFELGRGISLGSAYAIGSESFLGYRSEASIDQYAFGFKLSGVLSKDTLSYDVYYAILNNKMSKFAYTARKIRGNEYGHKFDQFRGPGVIDSVVAARMRWTPLGQKGKRAEFEPYFMYNDNPKQKVVFQGDARTKLGTIGLAGEFETGDLAFGFDTAFNLGSQHVKGIDRNIIKHENRDGYIAIINSSVTQAKPGQKPKKALYLPENQDIINCAQECSTENGKVIGTNANGELKNSSNRFRDPYVNKLRGSMFVADMSYMVCNPNFKVSLTAGYASGDRNPNIKSPNSEASKCDSEYKGFVSLMESYTGYRVKSTYLLSGSGKIPRILSIPSANMGAGAVNTVTRFTNIIFTGGGISVIPPFKKKWKFNPNVLAYWQDNQVTIPRSLNNKLKTHDLDCDNYNDIKISKFLGTEVNLFSGVELITDLNFWLIGTIFVPGKHFTQIKGRLANAGGLRIIDIRDKSGVTKDRNPVLSDDLSYFINFGLNYLF